MNRFFRFLLLVLTLGHFKWLPRLTWISRLIVFLGVSAGLAKVIRRVTGLDRKSSHEIDSAWADALRYSPPPAGQRPLPTNEEPEIQPSPSPASPLDTTEVSESISEVIGTTADGEMETITIHEVDADSAAESIVRIEEPGGTVETLVTGATVEELDLSELGSSSAGEDEPIAEELVLLLGDTSDTEPVTEQIEIIEIPNSSNALEAEEISAQALEEPAEFARESEPGEEPESNEETESIEEPLEITDEDPDILTAPDWIRGDGTHDCPDSHPVKAKASSMIFYEPESGHYDRTIPDVCFASAQDAEVAGYRAPRR